MPHSLKDHLDQALILGRGQYRAARGHLSAFISSKHESQERVKGLDLRTSKKDSEALAYADETEPKQKWSSHGQIDEQTTPKHDEEGVSEIRGSVMPYSYEGRVVRRNLRLGAVGIKFDVPKWE
ncbi:hypothetical protein VNO77_15226 [Canavalia gladiata]|uniref:Uncharacterized protein n=1 Tax=Canavalia gladiata TaxID=3824 RepID=A0AAN9QS97_CANGL